VARGLQNYQSSKDQKIRRFDRAGSKVRSLVRQWSSDFCFVQGSGKTVSAGKEKIPVPGVAATFRKLQAPTQEENIAAVYVVKISPENRFVVRTEFTT
jgi:hypothetical protein